MEPIPGSVNTGRKVRYLYRAECFRAIYFNRASHPLLQSIFSMNPPYRVRTTMITPIPLPVKPRGDHGALHNAGQCVEALVRDGPTAKPELIKRETALDGAQIGDLRIMHAIREVQRVPTTTAQVRESDISFLTENVAALRLGLSNEVAQNIVAHRRMPLNVNWTKYRDPKPGYFSDDESEFDGQPDIGKGFDVDVDVKLIVSNNTLVTHIHPVVSHTSPVFVDNEVLLAGENLSSVLTEAGGAVRPPDVKGVQKPVASMPRVGELKNVDIDIGYVATNGGMNREVIDLTGDSDVPESPMSTMSSLFGRSPSPLQHRPSTPHVQEQGRALQNYSLERNRVRIRVTDAVIGRCYPSHHPIGRSINADGSFMYFERIPLSHNVSKHWRRTLGQFVAEHVLGRPTQTNTVPLVLARFPENYVLYVLKTGVVTDEKNAKEDYFLYGSSYINYFRSPMEFGLHLKWLIDGMLMKSDADELAKTRRRRGARLCQCVHCREDGRLQKEITREYFAPSTRTGKRKVETVLQAGREARRQRVSIPVDLTKARDYRTAP